jgi:hypothetical protein
MWEKQNAKYEPFNTLSNCSKSDAEMLELFERK